MQVDTPVNLYNHPANRFVAGFIGSPSMNLIDAVVREEDGKLYIDIAKNIRLYIPENKQSVLKAYIDKPVCFWYSSRTYLFEFELQRNEYSHWCIKYY